MNPRIKAIAPEHAPEGIRPVLQQLEKALGMVPNLHKTLAQAPATLRAYVGMAQALGSGVLPPPLREQVAVAIAGLNDCSYCASAHTTLGRGLDLPEEELRRNLQGASADEKVAAALTFARSLVQKLGAVSDKELTAVREAGYGDPEILEIATHVGLNTFTNMVNRLVRTEVDFPLVETHGQSCSR